MAKAYIASKSTQAPIPRCADTFELDRTADDVESVHRSGKIASFIGMEGGHGSRRGKGGREKHSVGNALEHCVPHIREQGVVPLRAHFGMLQRRTVGVGLQFAMPMRASFPPFLVDMAARQLLRDGEELPLPPKAFQLLALLIERRPQAISQKELYDHLWPNSYVGAGSLHSLVHQLRSALDDHERRIIRTAYGFGFSFAAGVTEERSLRQQRFALVVERRRFELTDGENIIGRSDDAAVVLDHWSVSRHHARLLIAGDDTTVEDLDSKNGTYLNDRRIESATAVRAGDEILFGRIRASFRRKETAPSTRTDSAVRRRLNEEMRRK